MENSAEYFKNPEDEKETTWLKGEINKAVEQKYFDANHPEDIASMGTHNFSEDRQKTEDLKIQISTLSQYIEKLEEKNKLEKETAAQSAHFSFVEKVVTSLAKKVEHPELEEARKDFKKLEDELDRIERITLQN